MEGKGELKLYYTPEHQAHEPIMHLEYGQIHHHPEEPRRLECILEKLLETFFHTADLKEQGVIAVTREATDEEILRVHSPSLLRFLDSVWPLFREYKENEAKKGEGKVEKGEEKVEEKVGEKVEFIPTTWQPVCRHVEMIPEKGISQGGRYCFDTCTPVGEHSVKAAKQAAAAAVDASSHFPLTLPSPSSSLPHTISYVLARPPGHHATRGEYGGFCYFNQAAIAADILRSRLLLLPRPDQNHLSSSDHPLPPRCPVAIFDIDYHHGNGTQDIFYEDPEILYISLHASPDFDYPHFAGREDERGYGRGVGYNFNFPFPPNASFTDHYLPALHSSLEIIREKGCEVVVVSLGLDAAKGDPVGSYSLLPENYAFIARSLRSLNLPILVVQEGGYSDSLTLSSCVSSFLLSLTDPL